jgi:hypothetical protein
VVILLSKRFSFVHVVVPAVLIVVGFGIFQAASALTTAPANKYTGPEEKPQQWFTARVIGSLTFGEVLAPPAGQALIIKNAHLYTTAARTVGALYVDSASDPTSCGNTLGSANSPTGVSDTFALGDTTSDLSYQPGITVPAGDVLCMNPEGNDIYGQVYGYTLPSTYASTIASTLHPVAGLHLKRP